jgi:ketosteroid isomerase-like protein
MTTLKAPATTAQKPEDLARLVVERVAAGDADGAAALYEPDAALAFPPGRETVGRDAIRAVYAQLIDQGIRFEVEEPLPTVRHGDLALTSTRPKDGTGGRVQVARRQPDGTWLRIIDRPETPQP